MVTMSEVLNLAGCQVGNMDLELHEWARPEDISYPRPTFIVSPAAPGADVMAHTAAALAAASVVFEAQDAIYAGQLLDAAQSLYILAAANEGLYSDNFAPNAKVSLAQTQSASADICLVSFPSPQALGSASAVR